MDTYEKKYKDALEWMREMYPCLTDSLREDADYYFPELKDSEDKVAIEFLKGQAIEMIASIEHDISQSVYDGEKGHSPEDERELARWKSALAWLERQKEQKPAEWSEEDEKLRRNLMSLLANMRGGRITEETYQKYYPWLKSLRPSWKPSEEQMNRLSSIIAALRKDNCDDMADFLASIYHNLEKLM